MKRETERVSGILRDLLDFARPENASQSSKWPAAAADVEQIADDVFALVRPQRPFKVVALAKEIGDAGLRVTLAPQRLTQVLLNVVLNAGAAIAARGAKDGDAVTLRVRKGEGGARPHRD